MYISSDVGLRAAEETALRRKHGWLMPMHPLNQEGAVGLRCLISEGAQHTHPQEGMRWPREKQQPPPPPCPLLPQGVF